MFDTHFGKKGTMGVGYLDSLQSCVSQPLLLHVEKQPNN